MSPVVEMVVMVMEMSPVMERMSCAGLCKHCAEGVQGKSQTDPLRPSYQNWR